MKKTIIFTTIVALLTAYSANAQFTNGNIEARHFQGAEKIKGRVTERGNTAEEQATGSPFLNPDWGTGIITYRDGRVFNNVEMQYNLMNNELYFKKAEEIFMFTDTVASFQVTYAVNDDVKVEKFQAGYPPVDKYDVNQFYQVLGEGSKVHFVVNKNVKRLESYHYSEGKKINYFLTEEFYLFDVASATMKKIKKGEDAVIEALPAFSDKIRSLVKAQKLKLKNTEDITKLVAELNK